MRPVASQTPATPSADPFGFSGQRSATRALRVDVAERQLSRCVEPGSAPSDSATNLPSPWREGRSTRRYPAGPDAAAARIGRHAHPGVPVAEPLVVGERCAGDEVRSARRRARQEAEPGEGLEAVADAEHPPAAGQEVAQVDLQVGADAGGEHQAAGHVVAVGEAAHHGEHLVVGDAARVAAGEEVGEVDQVHLGAHHAEGLRRLVLAVEAEPDGDEHADGLHARPPSRFQARARSATSSSTTAAPPMETRSRPLRRRRPRARGRQAQRGGPRAPRHAPASRRGGAAPPTRRRGAPPSPARPAPGRRERST